MWSIKIKNKREFNKNIITLLTGTVLAQSLPIAISPILTRLYAPSDFGLMSLFISISTVLGFIANGRYELAIMLPEKDEDAISIVALSLVINFIFSSLILIVVIFFHNDISVLLGEKKIEFWLYIIPFAVFFIGLFNSLRFFNSRTKNYKNITRAVQYKSLVLCIVQIILGISKFASSGLIIGYIFSLLFSNLKLLNHTIKKGLYFALNFGSLKNTFIKYIRFPKFSVLSSLANSLSQYLINIFIPILFNISTLGYFALIQKVLSAPISLVSSSFGQVFFQQASNEKHETGMIIQTFKYSVKRLLIISIIIFSILYFTIEDIFTIIFGEQWKIAGTYAKLLIPLFLIRFIVSTLSSIFSLLEKQILELFINIGLLITVTIIIVLFRNSIFENFLLAYSLSMTVFYLFILHYMYKLSKRRYI